MPPGRQTPPRTPQIITYPGRTPTSPGKYITTTTKTPKYPPGLPPEKPPKYPTSFKPENYPRGSEIYRGGKTGGGEETYRGITEKRRERTRTTERTNERRRRFNEEYFENENKTHREIVEEYGGETTTIIPRHQFLIIEEWPPKTPKLRLHFDVIGSKWNIRNPIPRLGTGAYPKIELKIEDKVYSRDPMRYVEHRPYNKFVSWMSGSSWNVKNPVPRIRGGKYPKRELQVSNVNKCRFVSMTPAAVSKKGKVSVI